MTPTADLAQRFGVHPTMIETYKRALQEGSADIFGQGQKTRKQAGGKIDDLHRQIAKLKGRKRFFITQTRPLNRSQSKQMIDPTEKKLSLSRQCRMLGISRSSRYYKSRRIHSDDLELIRLIDEQYLKTPSWTVVRCEITSAGEAIK